MKNYRIVSAVLVLVFYLTTYGAAAQGTPPPAGEPIRIGVLNPTTGALASNGEDVNTGVRLYFESIGNEVAGRPIELVFADTAGDPQQGLDQARRLVGQENVDFLLGVVNSSVAIPVAQFAGENQVPLIVTVAGGTPEITGPNRSPYVFRTGITTSQQDPVLGWYAATELGKERAAVFAWDFAAGDARARAFADAFTAAGGEVVTEQRPPVGTTDFGPYIGQVDPGSVDVVYAYFAGAGAVAFVQQMSQFGLAPGIQVVGPGFLTEGEVLQAQGEAAAGIISATHYSPEIDTPENQAFLEFYEAEVGGEPGTYVEAGWVGAQVAATAIEEVGGNVADTEAFLDALANTEIQGPSGPIRFDERGQAIRHLYITRVEPGSDGDMALEVIDVIESVPQDWRPQ